MLKCPGQQPSRRAARPMRRSSLRATPARQRSRFLGEGRVIPDSIIHRQTHEPRNSSL